MKLLLLTKFLFPGKKEMFEEKFHTQSLLTEVFCTSKCSCGIYCAYKQSCTPNPNTLWHLYVPKII